MCVLWVCEKLLVGVEKVFNKEKRESVLWGHKERDLFKTKKRKELF